MKREDLLGSKDYWIFEIQNNLFNAIENYRREKGINKTQLASQLGFTKGYITQVLNGDFDHKISKLVELSLACDLIPLLHFVDKAAYIENDARDKIYEIFPVQRSIGITMEYQSLENTANRKTEALPSFTPYDPFSQKDIELHDQYIGAY